jgi:cell division protein FtsQ
MRSFGQRFLPAALLCCSLALLYWGWCYLKRPTSLPFHHVIMVYPVAHMDRQRTVQFTWQHLQGGFFSSQLDALRSALLQQPWVAAVSLRRRWPDTLLLSIEERHPEARWGLKGVIDDQGDIFYPPPNTLPKDLPIIEAGAGSKKDILNIFQRLKDDLQALDLHIKWLRVSRNMAYRLRLNNGIIVDIGDAQVLERFQRFVRLYPRLIAGKQAKVKQVDLHYANGLALQWQESH